MNTFKMKWFVNDYSRFCFKLEHDGKIKILYNGNEEKPKDVNFKCIDLGLEGNTGSNNEINIYEINKAGFYTLQPINMPINLEIEIIIE